MACNGHGHYEGCNCGWGGVWYGPGTASSDDDAWLFRPQNHRDRTETRQRETWSELSRGYVDPNATCPVCGAAVFFYESPYGGRVFFDELGPPWPKHGCTDNARFTDFRPVVAQPRAAVSEQPWERHGWQSWGNVYIEEIDDRLFRLRFSGQYPLITATRDVYFKAASTPAASAVRARYQKAFGAYELSILDFDEVARAWSIWQGHASLRLDGAAELEALQRRTLG